MQIKRRLGFLVISLVVIGSLVGVAYGTFVLSTAYAADKDKETIRQLTKKVADHDKNVKAQAGEVALLMGYLRDKKANFRAGPGDDGSLVVDVIGDRATYKVKDGETKIVIHDEPHE